MSQTAQSEPRAHVDLAEVWRALHERLFSFVRARVATAQDAEDLIQDVFARIQSRDGLDPDLEDPSAWLFRVTRNAIVDHHRRRAKESRVESALTADPTPVVPTRPASDESEADERARMLSACVRPFVDQLPEPYAEALRLTDLGGMSQAEAARQLGLSPSGMKSRVQRGRKMLRQLVVDCCEVQLDARKHIVDFEPRPVESSDCGDDGCGCR
jgi:RNA polymerase sigma-70 factor (ECF subfamily)